MAEGEESIEYREPGPASPSATARALDRAAPEKVDRFLDEQTDVLRLQARALRTHHDLVITNLRWTRFNHRMYGLLQTILLILGLGIVAALAGALWSAIGAEGVVIEAFSVPPDLEEQGLTGQVLATKLLDRL